MCKITSYLTPVVRIMDFLTWIQCILYSQLCMVFCWSALLFFPFKFSNWQQRWNSNVHMNRVMLVTMRHTHTHPFTEARDSEWQLHQLGHMQVCNSLQTNNHATTPPLSFLQARCPSCHPTNNVKALKALKQMHIVIYNLQKKTLQ